MKYIYGPTGMAREYSPLALNIYSGGCGHGCSYCYCGHGSIWGNVAHPRNLRQNVLAADAAQAARQVLLSFLSDPYGPIEMAARHTLAALRVLHENRCTVAVLTKGGTRCLRDIELFRTWPDRRIQIGATLTFASASESRRYEPGAALPDERIEILAALRAIDKLSQVGVRTWASVEPVIDAAESLAIIERSLPYVDAYAIGKLNHQASDVDWLSFGARAIAMIRETGKRVYVKHGLRWAMPGFEFRASECDPETIVLPDRPAAECVDADYAEQQELLFATP